MVKSDSNYYAYLSANEWLEHLDFSPKLKNIAPWEQLRQKADCEH